MRNRNKMEQMELFPDCGVAEAERLYIIGNGFDIHHRIESRYRDFKKWLQKEEKNGTLVEMMDTFFSNECEFWGDIEKALGDYREDEITNYCEPQDSDDFKYEHPGQWQAGVEDSIPYIFGDVMGGFRAAFDNWVRSIDICGIQTDLQLPLTARYLTFNYTETLEKAYGIPQQNVLHIHGSRLIKGDEFVIGHGNQRDENDPYGDDGTLLPYQNAYSEVINIMNQWTKDPQGLIEKNKGFFNGLNTCKGVNVIGVSYSDVDMPYLEEVAKRVAVDCKWVLNYYSEADREKAEKFAARMGLKDYVVKRFE